MRSWSWLAAVLIAVGLAAVPAVALTQRTELGTSDGNTVASVRAEAADEPEAPSAPSGELQPAALSAASGSTVVGFTILPPG